MNPRPGREGEDAAAAYLRTRGYRILERNYRCPPGEIDIIAEHAGVLCFVEVKSRSSLAYGSPAEAVNRAKQRHITRAAAYYLQARRQGADVACRFDVVAVVPDSDPELITDAFRVEY
jgi:putative endonuclease